ncbi:MAG TPA: CcmD family protein [Bacillota bacterium]|nr:CcmD family protein [Bacillota bacterium]
MSDLYIVMIVSLISWLGIFYYLWILDKRISRMEGRR